MKEVPLGPRRNIAVRFLLDYVNGPAPAYAPAIAFNAFIMVFAFTVGVVGILIIGSFAPGFRQLVDHTLVGAFPPGTRAEIQSTIGNLFRHPKTVGAISIAAMLWSGSALFSCLGGALNAIHRSAGRNVIHQRLIGLLLAVVLVLAVGLAIALEDVATALPGHTFAGYVVAAISLMFALGFVFRVAPNHGPALRESLPGAVVAAVLIVALTAIYSHVAGQRTPVTPPRSRGVNPEAFIFNRGIGEGIAQGVTLTLATLTWLYLLAHSLLIGGQVNEEFHRRKAGKTT